MEKTANLGLRKKPVEYRSFFVNIDIHLSTIFFLKIPFLVKGMQTCFFKLAVSHKYKMINQKVWNWITYNCFLCIFYSILGLLQLWRGWKFILPSLFCSWTSLLWSIPRGWLWKLFGCSIRMGKCFNVLSCPTMSHFVSHYVPNLPKIVVQRLWHCYKWHFWTVWICKNVISFKFGVAVKLSNFNKVKP